MFDQIQENIIKTRMIFAVYIIVATIMMYGIIWAFGAGAVYLVLSAVLAVVESFMAFFFGDQLIIKSLDAKPVLVGHNPLLDQVVNEMSLASGLPRPAVYQIDTASINACTVGRDPENATLIVTMGAATELKPDELRAVVAHEMAHIKNLDILYGTVLAALVGGFVVIWRILANWLSDIITQAILVMVLVCWTGMGLLVWEAGLWNPRRFIGYMLLFITIWVFVMSGRIAQSLFSRNREYLADVQAIEFTRFPEGLISALKKLKLEQNIVPSVTQATSHLFMASPEYLDQRPLFLTTHPPLEERIKRLRSLTEIPVQVQDYQMEAD